ncbi:RIP metalloprotease RseP [Chitinibacter fontanus]|uniref:Zinc metalloprotease n=1 Tax=Chitinibacter fontanus TaxID=1737446 RepID=A0A7D5ZAM8_9NEIS|nr:RIP metalloprotease RseP [Chitinibacter fontanus]QLI80084.1 RIP metalloprotease RseP [Chitinibacter fontanus]
MMLTLFAFAFAIALLVFVHEYGHYWVAKRCGVGVLTFSIGFGRPLCQWKRGETTWQLAAVPLGGFVRMMDETEAPVAVQAKNKAFNNKHPLQKMAVVFAGPLANLVFAVFAFSLCFVIGIQALKPQVASVQPFSAAYQAGIKKGDQILAVGDTTIDSWDQLQVELFDFAGESVADLRVQDQAGNVKQIALPLSQLSSEQFDQHLLGRLGLSPFASSRKIGAVQAQSPAALAGLRAGDEVEQINGNVVSDWSDVQKVVLASDHQSLQLVIKRNGQLQNLSITPRIELVEGKQVPRLGISPQADDNQNAQQVMTQQYDPVSAVVMGVKKTYQMSVMTLRMFGKMLIGALSPKQVSGPLGIAEYAGQSAAMGWQAYLQFLALISISLGVLNLLPVPILDGGHLLYHSYELITGKTVSLWVTQLLQKIGLALLLMLMALALFNDASRLLLG